MSLSGVAFLIILLTASMPVGTDHLFSEASTSSFRCRGTKVRPSDQLSALISKRPEGATFCILRGKHRVRMTLVPKRGQRFIGRRGAVISGSKLVKNWNSEGGRWKAVGQTQQSAPTSSDLQVCSPSAYDGCKYNEQVFFDKRSLRQVTSLSELSSGEFYFDYDADAIFIADNPNGHRIEASVVGIAFSSLNANVTIKNLIIERFGNPAQTGAISSGIGWLISRNEVRQNHGAGIHSDTRSRVIGNHIHHNGQLGIHGLGNNSLIARNEIAFNNVDGFSTGFEAGGAKWIKTRDLVVRNNRVHHNIGPGLWTDIDNIGTLYEGNRVVRNTIAGIVHEISYRAVVRNNVIIGNGHRHPVADKSLWGAGIQVDQSSSVEIFGNRLRRNANGITATQMPGGSGAFGPHEVKDLFVHDNVVRQAGGGYAAGLYVGEVTDSGVFYSDHQNRYVRNHYYLGQAKPFYWLGAARTRQEWVGFGQDTSGTFEGP
jgi:parallel beta-helix repeat protein